MDTLIKKVEDVIQMINYDQILIDHKLWDRQTDLWELTNKLLRIKSLENGITLKWQREKLDILHQKLDKLTFSNNNSYKGKGKSIHSCLSVGEIDKQKLSFLMGHGCKSMVDERKLLREINTSQNKDCATTIDELDKAIHELKRQLWFCGDKKQVDADTEKAILKEIKEKEMAKEKDVANAVVNGKLWKSLGSKKDIQAQVLCNKTEELRERQLKVRPKIRKLEKESERAEKDVKLLQKRLADTIRKKTEACSTILNLKNQYVEKEALKADEDLRIEQSYEDLEEQFEPDEKFFFDAIIQLKETN